MSITEDMLTGYALGHLTPEEEATVEAHLKTHPEAAATVAGYLEGLAELVMALPPEPLTETGEAELLARVRAAATASSPAPSDADDLPPVVTLPERPPERARGGGGAGWWLGALSAAAVAAALYVSVFAPPEPEARVAGTLQEYQAEPGAVSYTLEREGQAEPLGTLVRLQDGRVFVALSAPPQGERVYQAWAIADAPVSLGTFDGRTFLSTAAVAEGNTFGLTLEPPGGSEQPTSTPITLVEL